MTKTKQYKNTPIGPIPTDWEMKKLGEVVEFLDGKRKPIKDSDRSKMRGSYPYYGASGIIDYVNDFIFNDELILLGEDGANIINRSSPLAFMVEGKIWVNNHAHVLKPYSHYNRAYVTEYLESISYDKFNTGTAQPKLNKDICSKILIPLPPLPEQQKIADVLSTWDKAVQNTDAIIKKLEDRNKALAFSLLTGKKRVKGFEGKEFKKSFANQVFKSVSIKNNTENLELLSSTQEYGIIPRSLLETRVTMPSGGLNTYKLVQKGDFVISLRSFQGGIEYSDYTGIISPAYTVLKPLHPINDSFYKYYFKSKDLISRLSVAVIGIRDGKNISYDDFSTIILPNPSLKEQTAIAKILNTAHQELKQYQEKLKVLQKQKKGLMQQLLTGKVRTI